ARALRAMRVTRWGWWMAKPRKAGDWVWLRYGERVVRAQIQNLGDDSHIEWCCMCADPECREWTELIADGGERHYHVNECRMFNTQRAALKAQARARHV